MRLRKSGLNHAVDRLNIVALESGGAFWAESHKLLVPDPRYARDQERHQPA